MGAPQLWTFGHSTRSEDETVALMREYDIGTVVDVRSIRGSRHNPQFGHEVMPAWLAAAGIDYRWIENLGGRRRKQDVDPSVNAGWTHPSFHRYADYALGDDFAAGLVELATLVTGATSMTPPAGAGEPSDPSPSGPQRSTPQGTPRAAIMCAEAVPWRCHRSLIATALVVRGWHVTHIIGPGQTRQHQIGAWGATPVVDADGRITYPA